ncbi:hypothetical protein HDU90_008046 [Geranomyces variabilis]|nr:hypothetical protein HDU90_008046 [Geranomyces variabilis]
MSALLGQVNRGKPELVSVNAFDALLGPDDDKPDAVNADTDGDEDEKKPVSSTDGPLRSIDGPTGEENVADPSIETAEKKKKKKKKPAAVQIENELQAVVDKIESPITPAAPANQCAAPRCVAKTGILGVVCAFCNRRFCMAHRHPESHSERCGEQQRTASRTAGKRDATLIIEAVKRDPTVGKSLNGAAKEREDARRRLKERIESASGNKAKATAKKKK